MPEIHNDLEQFARVHATDVNSLHRSSLGSWKGCSAPDSARANASAVSVRESISVTLNGDESALTMRLLDSVCVSVRTLEQTKSISLTFNAIECERAGLCLFESAYTHTDGIQQPRRHLGVLHWIRLKHPEGNGFRLCECKNTQTNGAHLIHIPWHASELDSICLSVLTLTQTESNSLGTLSLRSTENIQCNFSWRSFVSAGAALFQLQQTLESCVVSLCATCEPVSSARALEASSAQAAWGLRCAGDALWCCLDRG